MVIIYITTVTYGYLLNISVGLLIKTEEMVCAVVGIKDYQQNTTFGVTAQTGGRCLERSALCLYLCYHTSLVESSIRIGSLYVSPSLGSQLTDGRKLCTWQSILLLANTQFRFVILWKSIIWQQLGCNCQLETKQNNILGYVHFLDIFFCFFFFGAICPVSLIVVPNNRFSQQELDKSQSLCTFCCVRWNEIFSTLHDNHTISLQAVGMAL